MMNSDSMMKTATPRWLRVVAIAAILFGVMTIKEGGSVVLVDGLARAAAGQYVPLVVWFNFLAGFGYVATGVGLWRNERWAPRLALGIAAATLLVFAALGVYIAAGHAFEMRTVIAMTVRSVLWLAVALLLQRTR